jgi:nitrite reductase/ring-hydroxylating ferredoxin subunit
MTDAPRLDRRLFGCAALAGVAGPILVACSSDRSEDTGDSGTGGDAGASPEGDSSAKAGAPLVAAAEVPVGGGVALTDLRIVVTQPEQGQFKAWSGICTHQGGAITTVEDGEMICSLHQSHFAIDDGDVVSGPASNPLPEVEVRVQDGQVVRA